MEFIEYFFSGEALAIYFTAFYLRRAIVTNKNQHDEIINLTNESSRPDLYMHALTVHAGFRDENPDQCTVSASIDVINGGSKLATKIHYHVETMVLPIKTLKTPELYNAEFEKWLNDHMEETKLGPGLGLAAGAPAVSLYQHSNFTRLQSFDWARIKNDQAHVCVFVIVYYEATTDTHERQMPFLFELNLNSWPDTFEKLRDYDPLKGGVLPWIMLPTNVTPT